MQKSLRFLFNLRQKCPLGRGFAPLDFYYSPRKLGRKANPREQSHALGDTSPWDGKQIFGIFHFRWGKETFWTKIGILTWAGKCWKTVRFSFSFCCPWVSRKESNVRFTKWKILCLNDFCLSARVKLLSLQRLRHFVDVKTARLLVKETQSSWTLR